MQDDIISYYARELAYIRKSANIFASQYPAIAKRLRIDSGVIEDPHISRLIEAFAFLTARIAKKIDDDLPEIYESMLNILYPHYLLPFPSLAIVQFTPSGDKKAIIQAGTILESSPINDVTCKFTSCYPVELLPLQVSYVRLSSKPLPAPLNPSNKNCEAVLTIKLSCLATDKDIAIYFPAKVRFFIRGNNQESYPLYELIMNDVIAIALARSPDDKNPIFIEKQNIIKVGFAATEGLIDYSSRSFIGYRLISEYFVFPEKFLFFDLTIHQLAENRFGNEISIFFYLKKRQITLERLISADNLVLNCTPVINLFKQSAEPIMLEHNKDYYQIIPDIRNLDGLEIYKITKVSGLDNSGKTYNYLPFYSVNHYEQEEQNLYWHSKRLENNLTKQSYINSDVFIALVSKDFNPIQMEKQILSIETLCFNRDLPRQLPIEKDSLKTADPLPCASSVQFIVPPTAAINPIADKSRNWRLISHLALNTASLTSMDTGNDLKEILSLYDLRQSNENKILLQSIKKLTSKPAFARNYSNFLSSFCRGYDFTLEFDESYSTESSVYLFATIIEIFLGLYCQINSFTRLSIKIQGQEEIKWPARAGNKIII